MNRGVRHRVQRERRKALKADCAILLARHAARYAGTLTDREAREIAEMVMRLAPPPGRAVPIILTGYTKGGKA